MVLALILAGCDTPVDPKQISATPASARAFAQAQKAVTICGKNFPKLEKTAVALRAAGFKETTEGQFAGINRMPRFAVMQNSEGDVLVVLGNRSERVCLVGVEDLTPQQAFDLAQPWVRQYVATTNAENGQGLSKSVVQAWRSQDLDRTVFISATKTFPFFDDPGAAVRLIYFD